MILENFHIHNDVGLKIESHLVDLHSNYLFCGFSYVLMEKRVVLDWRKRDDHWAKEEPFARLRMIFNDVSYFSVKSREQCKPFSEDSCLAFIGYLHPEDKEIMNGFLPKEKAKGNYDMILVFESDFAIKLYAETVRMELDSTTFMSS